MILHGIINGHHFLRKKFVQVTCFNPNSMLHPLELHIVLLLHGWNLCTSLEKAAFARVLVEGCSTLDYWNRSILIATVEISWSLKKFCTMHASWRKSKIHLFISIAGKYWFVYLLSWWWRAKKDRVQNPEFWN